MAVVLQKFDLNPESHQAFEGLWDGHARSRPSREATEDVIELGHGFSRETLAKLTRDGFVTLVTETLRIEGGTVTIERIHISDAGRPASKADEIEVYARALCLDAGVDPDSVTDKPGRGPEPAWCGYRERARRELAMPARDSDAVVRL